MKVLIYVFANTETGLGHWYRMKALSRELIEQKHNVWIVSDKKSDWFGVSYWPAKPNNKHDWSIALRSIRPDWVIVDLCGDIPNFVREANKLCIIGGIGQPISKDADLVIGQGEKGKYHAPEYLILRQELARYEKNRGKFDFVFGGSSDPMNLAELYRNAFPNRNAHIISPKGSNSIITGGEAIFGLMSLSNRAIVATGMILWELAYLGLPVYAFSKTQKHLKTALWMERLGLVKAYPKVGLPEKSEFREFVSQSFEPTGEKPDLNGTSRIVELLEKKS